MLAACPRGTLDRVRTALAGAWLMTLIGCGAKTGLGIPDAQRMDAGSIPDATMPDVAPADVFVCPDGECDCLTEGTVRWSDVGYAVYCDGPTLYSAGGDPLVPGWGSRVWLRVRCLGHYRFCARVVPRSGPECTIVESCTDTHIADPSGWGAMAPPPGFNVSNACFATAMERSGIRTCVSISYVTRSGERGGMDLGCFAEDGPWSCEPGPPVDSDDVDPERDEGDWEF